MNIPENCRDMQFIKQHYKKLIKECQDIVITNNTDDYISYYPEEYARDLHFPENMNATYLKSISYIDKKVEELLNMDNLFALIAKYADINALIVCNHFAFVWDDEENFTESKARNMLEYEYNDEYAREICEAELGITWVERQIIIINVSELISVENSMGFHNDEFEIGLISTIFHELRHLVYECNEFVELGISDYPHKGGIEEYVEAYGNYMAEKYESEYLGHILKNQV